MLFHSWRCALRATPRATRLLVTSEQGDVLKAQFEPRPAHPRALLTLLEGLSLWRGHPPLVVALSVDDDCLRWPGSTRFDDELWPGESPLVHFDIVPRARRQVRLEGLGNFRLERGVSSGRRP